MKPFCVVNPMKDWKENDYPAPPFVKIGIAAHIRGESSIEEITPNLMTDAEIDTHVDRLHEELDRVRREAKSTLRRESDRVLAAVKGRSS